MWFRNKKNVALLCLTLLAIGSVSGEEDKLDNTIFSDPAIMNPFSEDATLSYMNKKQWDSDFLAIKETFHKLLRHRYANLDNTKIEVIIDGFDRVISTESVKDFIFKYKKQLESQKLTELEVFSAVMKFTADLFNDSFVIKHYENVNVVDIKDFYLIFTDIYIKKINELLQASQKENVDKEMDKVLIDYFSSLSLEQFNRYCDIQMDSAMNLVRKKVTQFDREVVKRGENIYRKSILKFLKQLNKKEQEDFKDISNSDKKWKVDIRKRIILEHYLARFVRSISPEDQDCVIKYIYHEFYGVGVK